VKSGLVALVGRPNVGKSTLLNALLGRKLAIMSDKPQTTRSVVRGVLRREAGEAVLVDTPGLHKPQTLLGERLNSLVRGTLSEVDLVCLLVDAAAGVGRGDRFLAEELARVGTPAICVVNKLDAVSKARLAQALQAAGELGDWAEVVPVSARTGEQLGLLVELVFAHLRDGPPLYPEGEPDPGEVPEQRFVAEVVREKALALVHDELPHSVAVVVEEIVPGEQASPDNPVLVVRADLYVERPSQKPILIGRQGAVLREIGTRARAELEGLLGARVYLDLHVRIAREWQRDPKLLARLGF
jgi:GTP-binding protein Era